MDRDKIKELIYSESAKLAPGLVYALDMVCMDRGGKPCVDLLLDSPREFLSIVREVYGDDDSLKLVLEIVFVKPLSRLGLRELARSIQREVER